MKTLLVITPHSILDVITNSSTELFVCDTNKTVEMIKEMLAANPNVKGYQEPWVFNLEEYREWKRKYRYTKENVKTSEEWDKLWESKYADIHGWFFDLEDEDDLKELRMEFIDYGDRSDGVWCSDRNPFDYRLREASEIALKEFHKNNEGKIDKIQNTWNVSHEARDKEAQKIYEEIEALPADEKPRWWINPLKFHYNTQSANDLDGKVIIVGDNDNSIPYTQFEWIEKTFNARRHHQG